MSQPLVYWRRPAPVTTGWREERSSRQRRGSTPGKPFTITKFFTGNFPVLAFSVFLATTPGIVLKNQRPTLIKTTTLQLYTVDMIFESGSFPVWKMHCCNKPMETWLKDPGVAKIIIRIWPIHFVVTPFEPHDIGATKPDQFSIDTELFTLFYLTRPFWVN